MKANGCAFLMALAVLASAGAAAAAKVVDVSDVDPHYFRDASGATWVPVGCNICFDRTDATSAEMRRRFDGWMTALAKNGGNYMRLWLGTRRTDVMPAKAYAFDRENEENLVWIVRRAEELGLKMKLTFEHFRETSSVPAPDNPYPGTACVPGVRSFAKPLYGPYAKDMGEFFRSEKCFGIYLAKARRVAELVGDSPAVMAVETWNEINATCAPLADIEAWSDRMNAELKRLFPRQLVLTDLGSFADAADGLWYDYLARQKDNDYLQVHRYRDPGAASDVARGPMDVLCADAIRELRDRRDDVPAILAETGATERWHSGVSHFYELDRDGVLLHDAIFAPFFAGSAGSGQPWHWDHQYISRHNLWWHFRRFRTAIDGIDPAKEHLKPFHLETARLRVWGLRGERTVIGWCRDKLDTIRDSLEWGRKPLPVEGERLPKAALGGGEGVDWYLPFEDRHVVVEKGTEVPVFTRSIVFRAVRRP